MRKLLEKGQMQEDGGRRPRQDSRNAVQQRNERVGESATVHEQVGE